MFIHLKRHEALGVFMNRIFTLLVCLLSIKSFGQIGEKVNEVLSKRDLNTFGAFSEQNTYEKNRVNFYQEYTRELVEGYQESVFYIRKSLRGCLELQDHKICILTQGNLIISYNFTSDNWLDEIRSDSLKSTTYSFVDTVRVAALKVRFQKCFLAPLNEKELFKDDIWYGAKCRMDDKLTDQQEQIKNWVIKKDTVNLFTWLQSTNTEKQIFAVQGFHSLQFMGVKINDDAKRLISFIMKKKGNIKTCRLDDHISYKFVRRRRESIADVVKDFKFSSSPDN